MSTIYSVHHEKRTINGKKKSSLFFLRKAKTKSVLTLHAIPIQILSQIQFDKRDKLFSFSILVFWSRVLSTFAVNSAYFVLLSSTHSRMHHNGCVIKHISKD